MEGGERSRLGVLTRVGAAAFAALFSALGAWLLLSSSSATAGSQSGPSLLPDLVVETPDQIVLQRATGTKKTFLRFSHTTANIGRGPLEIYPDLSTETCGDEGNRGRVAYQAIFQDSDADGGPDAVFDPKDDTETVAEPVGCMIFHDIHNHYHFEDFALYELYRMKSGQLRETSDKVSFCVVDILNPHPDLPGAPAQGVYGFENCDADDGTHGISVGWADIYNADTAGQEFDVSDRSPGRYCLVARTDPADRLDEVASGGEDNNAQAVQIRVNRKHATVPGRAVPVLNEPCAPPTP